MCGDIGAPNEILSVWCFNPDLGGGGIFLLRSSGGGNSTLLLTGGGDVSARETLVVVSWFTCYAVIKLQFDSFAFLESSCVSSEFSFLVKLAVIISASWELCSSSATIHVWKLLIQLCNFGNVVQCYILIFRQFRHLYIGCVKWQFINSYRWMWKQLSGK